MTTGRCGTFEGKHWPLGERDGDEDFSVSFGRVGFCSPDEYVSILATYEIPRSWVCNACTFHSVF